MRVLWAALLLSQGCGCARRSVPAESDAHDDNRDASSEQQSTPPRKEFPSKTAQPSDAGLLFRGGRWFRPWVATPVPSGAAVIDFGGSTSWAPSCLVHQPCPLMPRALHDCAANAKRGAGSHFDTPEPKLRGRQVRVKGTLVAGNGDATLARCAPATCCNHVRATVVVLTESDMIDLDGLVCGGDDSRMCCNAPAFGQTVIAMGRLMENESPLKAKWTLMDAELCVDD